MTSLLSSARRIVIKVGSALLIDQETGRPHASRFSAIAADAAKLREQGKAIVIVSSGAVALGRRALGLKSGKLRLEEKQAAAAAGQPKLMRAWEDALARYNAPVAQALLTFYDTEQRRRWLNARSTLEALIERGAIPVVNENDTVATEEIRYGDNDRLAARVAQMLGADVLALLSDVDGLYDSDPRVHAGAKHIPEVRDITPAILAMAGGANSRAAVGSGGMATKLDAARIAMTAGCATVITRGDPASPPPSTSADASSDTPGGATADTTADTSAAGPLSAVAAGARATWFIPGITPETARRQWLAGALKAAGAVRIDAGAAAALKAGKSLLAAGVTAVSGRFERGDAIDVVDPAGKTIARGVSAYSSEDAAKLIGRKSDDFEAILGYRGRPSLIHVDDMVRI